MGTNNSHKFNESCKQRKWMNKKPSGMEPYNPTLLEHYANIVTHGVVIVPSLIAVYYMIKFTKSHAQYKSALIYGASLILLFIVSTAFHTFSCVKKYSYTPWLYLRSTNHILGEYMLLIVWVSAILGVVYQIVYHEKYKFIETIFYISVAVCPSLVVVNMTDVSGIFELAVGGVLYIVGVVFFKSDGVIPFAHSIWHCFVVLGACMHYYASLKYLVLVDHHLTK